MTLNPFVMGSAKKPTCFDEAPPCTLEQTSMCVISVTQQADSQSKFPGQDKYVPWLVCMDTNDDAISKCHKDAGVDPSAVSQCMNSKTPELLRQYLKVDAGIRQTPTVHINGKNIEGASYRAIHEAICKVDPSLKGCSSNASMPLWADTEPVKSHFPARQAEIVV